MKILKIFGLVVGIHVFALVLIFANPGCSSSTHPSAAATDAMAAADAASTRPRPASTPQPAASGAMSPAPAPAPAPIAFNPDAPAMAPAGSNSAGGVRFTPTRPGTTSTPVMETLVPEPVADVTPVSTYAVKAGDSLWSIAKKNHLAVGDLASANGLAPAANIRPGQKLVIPGKATSPQMATTPKGPAAAAAKNPDAFAASPAPARASGEVVKHTVKSGETLGIIARNYGVKQGDIAVANNISDPAKIRAGMELIIPGWQATTKSAKGSKTGSKSSASKDSPESASSQSAPAPQPSAPPVPIIRLDDNPLTPAPKP